MTKLVTSVGNHMLNALLKTSEAGACVPEKGEVCACITDTSRQPGTGYCTNRKWIYFQFTHVLNCYGRCGVKTSNVCGQAQSGQSC